MKVLVIGSGAREHALIWKLKQSPKVTGIYAAPGSAAIAELAECVDIPVSDQPALVKFAMNEAIDLTVVGPEAPLVDGIVDRFQKRGLRVFGPTARAARLEGSKGYAKDVCGRHSIPTGYSRTFKDYDLAEQYLRNVHDKVVIKADGLAAGKGVIICDNAEEAIAAARKIMRERAFGETAGATILVEEFLEGEEISVLAISDGHTIIPFEPAQDHKAIGEGDTGPNTGGMGTYSPLPQFKPELIEEIERDVVVQAIHAMNREGEEFRGCLFTGLMVTDDGPKVLEFNVRFGDPEIQTLVRRLKSDLFPLLWHAADGTLDQCEVEWDSRPAVNIVLAAGGYPGKTMDPTRINGLDNDFDADVQIFHAGTKRVGGLWYTAGGRVLSVSAIADTLEGALEKAYEAAELIEFSGKQMRRDIAHRALKK